MQVNQQQLLVDTTALFLKQMSTPPQEERCVFFDANRVLRMGTSVERRGFSKAGQSDFQHENMNIVVTCTGPQVGAHLRAGSADLDAPVASAAEAQRYNHRTRARHASFDKYSANLGTITVELCSRLGRDDSDSID